MAVSLKKGGNVSLTKAVPALKRILVGLGWNGQDSHGKEFDLDASAFLLNERGKVRREEDFVFYHNLQSTCKSVEHTGDDKTGGGADDAEAIKIDLVNVPDAVKKIVICVSIYDEDNVGWNFGQVTDAYIRIVNLENDVEIARFDLTEDFSMETAAIFGEIYKHEGEWKFKAIGLGNSGGLEAICGQFGINVA